MKSFMMKKWLEKNISKIVLIVITTGFATLILNLLAYANTDLLNFSFKVNPQTSSYFGNFIGGIVGTIFAFATILLVWMTYEVQKKELKETQTVLGLQQFEATFFELLKTQRVIKKSVSFHQKKRFATLKRGGEPFSNVISGDTFFEAAMKDFSNLYNIDRLDTNKWNKNITEDEFLVELYTGVNEDNYPREQPIERIKFVYKKYFDRYHNYLGHYFRHTYHILNYLCEKMSKEFKAVDTYNKRVFVINKYQFYAEILQSQMSSSELFLMFYNGICFPKTKMLIENFKLLENLSAEDLADPELHPSLYKSFTFKSRNEILD